MRWAANTNHCCCTQRCIGCPRQSADKALWTPARTTAIFWVESISFGLQSAWRRFFEDARLSSGHLLSSEWTQSNSAGSQCNCVQHTRQDWGNDKDATVLGELCQWEHTPVFPYASRVLVGKWLGPGWACEKSHNWTPQPTREQLRKHFPTMDTARAWIRNPFEISLPVPQLSFHEQEQLIELSSDGALQPYNLSLQGWFLCYGSS